MTTKLIISVDTEEEGLWGGDYKVANNTTENLRGLPRFQAFCESLGVPPTYLIDAPVLDDQLAVKNLRKWWDSDVCEVGAHCHPWCNPPISESLSERETSFVCNLPLETQFRKLEWLTNQISCQFQKRPSSYRAGRYGFDACSAQILADLGYLVDSSVLPLFDYTDDSGPDFFMSDPEPSVFEFQTTQLVELPITAGFTRGDYHLQRNLWTHLRRQPFKKFRVAGVADSIGLVRKLKLSPEGTRLRDLVAMVDQSIQQGRTTLVMMLHSSSLVPGFSPYARDDAMLEKIYERISGVVHHLKQKYNTTPITLSDAAVQYSDAQKAKSLSSTK